MMKAVTMFCHGRPQGKVSISVSKDSLYPKVSVRYDTQVSPVGNIRSYTSQEPTPSLCALALDNGEGYWINLIISICRHCNHQFPFIFSIEVGCINANHRPTLLEPNNTWTKRPKYGLECTGSLFLVIVHY